MVKILNTTESKAGAYRRWRNRHDAATGRACSRCGPGAVEFGEPRRHPGATQGLHRCRRGHDSHQHLRRQPHPANERDDLREQVHAETMK